MPAILCGASNPKGVTYLMEWRLFNGMMRRIKKVSNVPIRFPEYGMTNASNFRRGLPPANNPLLAGGRPYINLLALVLPYSGNPREHFTPFLSFASFH